MNHLVFAHDLARIAASAPHALTLALQLFDVWPCPTCGYVHTACRCTSPLAEDERAPGVE